MSSTKKYGVHDRWQCENHWKLGDKGTYTYRPKKLVVHSTIDVLISMPKKQFLGGALLEGEK